MANATALEVAIAAQGNVGRPPHVRFELRAVEDRKESIEKGHYVGVDTPFVLITPRGSKDVHEEIAAEWFQKMEQEVREERIPAIWLDDWRVKFDRWKAGSGEVVKGTPLREWPPIRPALLRTCTEMGILSVEDLADANEEAVASLGMGGRSLRQQAINWLQAAQNLGIPTAKIASLEAENQSLKTRLESMDAITKELKARLDAKDQIDAGQINIADPKTDPNKIVAADLLDNDPPQKSVAPAASAAFRKL